MGCFYHHTTTCVVLTLLLTQISFRLRSILILDLTQMTLFYFITRTIMYIIIVIAKGTPRHTYGILLTDPRIDCHNSLIGSEKQCSKVTRDAQKDAIIEFLCVLSLILSLFHYWGKGPCISLGSKHPCISAGTRTITI